MLFSEEYILKRNFHFCLCILSQTLFSPISSPLPPPPPPVIALDCIIDANTVTRVRSGGSSSLLLCNTLSENIKWRKQPHATGGKSACQWSHSRSRCFGIVSSRWLRTKKCDGKSRCMFRSHIHYLVLSPTLLSSVVWIHHHLILKHFFRFPSFLSSPHQPQQTIRLVEHNFFARACVTQTWNYR